MYRKGSGALILIILLVMGAGYYLSQNPNALEQVQNNLDIQMPSGAGSGGSTSKACEAALNELRPVKAEDTTLTCTCSEQVQFERGSAWIALVKATGGNGDTVKSIALIDNNFNVQDMRDYMKNGEYTMSKEIRDAQEVSKCSLT